MEHTVACCCSALAPTSYTHGHIIECRVPRCWFGDVIASDVFCSRRCFVLWRVDKLDVVRLRLAAGPKLLPIFLFNYKCKQKILNPSHARTSASACVSHANNVRVRWFFFVLTIIFAVQLEAGVGSGTVDRLNCHV